MIEKCLERERTMQDLKTLMLKMDLSVEDPTEVQLFKTFKFFIMLRSSSVALLKAISEWQQTFTKLKRPQLMEKDYLVGMMSDFDYFGNAKAKKYFDFVLGRGNFLLLPRNSAANASKAQPPREVSQKLADIIYKFVNADQVDIRNSYQVMVDSLSPFQYRKLYSATEWLTGASWVPHIVITNPTHVALSITHADTQVETQEGPPTPQATAEGGRPLRRVQSVSFADDVNETTTQSEVVNTSSTMGDPATLDHSANADISSSKLVQEPNPTPSSSETLLVSALPSTGQEVQGSERDKLPTIVPPGGTRTRPGAQRSRNFKISSPTKKIAESKQKKSADESKIATIATSEVEVEVSTTPKRKKKVSTKAASFIAPSASNSDMSHLSIEERAMKMNIRTGGLKEWFETDAEAFQSTWNSKRNVVGSPNGRSSSSSRAFSQSCDVDNDNSRDVLGVSRRR